MSPQSGIGCIDDFVAQLVEQMTLNHWVEGSSPSEVTKKDKSGNDFVAQLVEQMTLNHWVEGSSPSEVTRNDKLFRSLLQIYICERLFLFVKDRKIAYFCSLKHWKNKYGK